MVWRNDQKQKASAMMRANNRAAVEEAAMRRAQDADASPVGLFSRGDSSAPPTPIMRPFRTTTLNGGANGGGGGHASAVVLNANRQSLAAAGGAAPLPSGAQARTGDGVPAEADAHMQMRVTPFTHAHLYPGQAMTQSALGDNPDFDIRLNGPLDLPATPSASMLDQTLPTRTARAAPAAAATAAPVTNPSAPAAGATAASAATLVPAVTFTLPSVASLRQLHPSHFFAWREQVRQHIALLQLQHGLHEPVHTSGQQAADLHTPPAALAAPSSPVAAGGSLGHPSASSSPPSGPLSPSAAAVAAPLQGLNDALEPHAPLGHADGVQAFPSERQPGVDSAPVPAPVDTDGAGFCDSRCDELALFASRRAFSPDPDVCSRSVRSPSLAHMASLGGLELHVLSPRSPTPSDAACDDAQLATASVAAAGADAAGLQRRRRADRASWSHIADATVVPLPSTAAPAQRRSSAILVPQRPVTIALHAHDDNKEASPC